MVYLQQLELDFLVKTVLLNQFFKIISGLKILLTCYQKILHTETMNIQRAVRPFCKNNEMPIAFCKLLDYVNANKGPLYLALKRHIDLKVRKLSMKI